MSAGVGIHLLNGTIHLSMSLHANTSVDCSALPIRLLYLIHSYYHLARLHSKSGWWRIQS
jgi:hypothetical protein